MPGYLLDTNVVSVLVSVPHGAVAQRVARAGEANVFTSVIVAGALRYGELKRPSPRLSASLGAVMGALRVEPIDQDVVAHYARLRASLERAGTPIGGNDMWIAAHALALEATLVSRNEREFERVEGLRVDNWLR